LELLAYRLTTDPEPALVGLVANTHLLRHVENFLVLLHHPLCAWGELRNLEGMTYSWFWDSCEDEGKVVRVRVEQWKGDARILQFRCGFNAEITEADRPAGWKKSWPGWNFWPELFV
jgi:hypothetical protein